MRAPRRALGLSVVAAVCVVTFATPASADDAVQVLGGEPAVETYDPAEEPVKCLSADTRAVLAEGPAISVCTPPATFTPTVTYNCWGSAAVAPESNVMQVTMNGSASTSDTRVLFTRITCTLRQGSTTVSDASGSAYARAAFVEARTTAPLATYRICKSGAVQYRDNNGAIRWFSFGNANC